MGGKWVPRSQRKPGILYTNPSIDPDQAPAEGSGRWEQSLFDQTVVMTSSSSSNLPLKAGNSVALPHGIMPQCVHYGRHAQPVNGGMWPFQLPERLCGSSKQWLWIALEDANVLFLQPCAFRTCEVSQV